MTADVGYTKPTNEIIVAGEPLKQTLKIETAATMYAGRLVKKGTTDHDIVVGTEDAANIGWLSYEHTIKKYRPATVDTIYTVNSHVVVVNGGHFVIVASLASGENVSKGAVLCGTAAGEVKAATIGTDLVCAIAEESVDASAAAADIMVRSLI